MKLRSHLREEEKEMPLLIKSVSHQTNKERSLQDISYQTKEKGTKLRSHLQKKEKEMLPLLIKVEKDIGQTKYEIDDKNQEEMPLLMKDLTNDEKNNTKFVTAFEESLNNSVIENITALHRKFVDLEKRIDEDLKESKEVKRAKAISFLEDMFSPITGDLHRVLTEFLTLQDIAKLDTAISDKKLRKGFLHFLKEWAYKTHITERKYNYPSDSMSPCMFNWLKRRSIIQ